MKNLKRLLILPLVFACVFSAACSTQYREGAATLSDEELTTLLTKMVDAGGAGAFSALSQDLAVNSQIYHAGSTQGRPAPSILGLLHMDLFDSEGGWGPGVESRDTNISRADAVFIDAINEDGTHLFSLGFRMEFPGENAESYFFATSNGEYSYADDSFSVKLVTNSSQTFILRTHDVSDEYTDELAQYVQFDIYYVEGGTEYFVGQISTMANYSYQ